MADVTATADEEGSAPQALVQGEEEEASRGLKVTLLSFVAIAVAAVLLIASVFIIFRLVQVTHESEQAHDRYDQCSAAASELMVASDYLTTECRMFVMTGDRQFMDAYVKELTVTKRRDAAMATLTEFGGNERAAADLMTALGKSNELATLELYSMKLVCEAMGVEPMPDVVAAATIRPEDAALAPDEKRANAEKLVLGDLYRELKSSITDAVDACATDLVMSLESKILDLDRSIDVCSWHWRRSRCCSCCLSSRLALPTTCW